MPHSPTLNEVALIAGVSRSTASAVLNGSKGNIRVSEATRRRIQAVAQELGYRPNKAAVALATRRSNTIALTVYSLRNRSAALYANAIVQLLHDAGKDALIIAAELEDGLRRVQRNSVDGVIVLSQDPTELEACAPLIDLVHQGIPHVVVGTPCSLNVSAVFPDRAGGVYAATQHLVTQGHRAISFVGKPGHPVITERIEGLTRALTEHGLGNTTERVFPYTDPNETERFGSQLWSLPQPPTALIAEDDWLALHIMKGIYQTGRSIPGDISIVGFGDQDVASLSHIPLTTVRYPYDEIAATAISILSAQMDTDRQGIRTDARQVRVPMSLVVRKSTALFRKGKRLNLKPKGEV